MIVAVQVVKQLLHEFGHPQGYWYKLAVKGQSDCGVTRGSANSRYIWATQYVTTTVYFGTTYSLITTRHHPEGILSLSRRYRVHHLWKRSATSFWVTSCGKNLLDGWPSFLTESNFVSHLQRCIAIKDAPPEIAGFTVWSRVYKAVWGRRVQYGSESSIRVPEPGLYLKQSYQIWEQNMLPV